MSREILLLVDALASEKNVGECEAHGFLQHALGTQAGLLRNDLSPLFDFGGNFRFFQEVETLRPGCFLAVACTDCGLRGVEIHEVFVNEAGLLVVERFGVGCGSAILGGRTLARWHGCWLRKGAPAGMPPGRKDIECNQINWRGG